MSDEAVVQEPEEEIDEFAAAFAEGDGTETEEVTIPQEPEAKPEGEPQPQPEPAPEATKEEPEAQPHVDEPIDWEKRAKDHQSAFTKSQQKLAELEKKLAELEKKPEEQPEKKDPTPVAEEIPSEIREFYDLYPEMKTAINYEASQLIKKAFGDVDLRQVVDQISKLEADKNYLLWESEVLTEHPDARKITAETNKEYWDWYKGKNYGPCDAPTAITRISEFKEEVLKKAAAEHDANVKTEADKLKDTMAGTLQSRPTPKPKSKPDPSDFGAGYNEA